MKYALYAFVLLLIGVAVTGYAGRNSGRKATTRDDVVRLSARISKRSYAPASFDVPLGSTVELTVTNEDEEQHGLSVPDFGVRDFVGAGQTKTVRFLADKLGPTSTFCSESHPEKLIINVVEG